MRDVSFELRRGEILGIAGLVGSGRTELALTIFGITPATSGTILLDGKPVAITSPRQARDLGIAYVPEDRGLQGLVRPMTMPQNVSLASLDRLSRGIFIDFARASSPRREADQAARHPRPRRRAGGRASSPAATSRRWCSANGSRPSPRILIMDEPTRGIDVGAKAEIHALMGELAQQGMAILMISSELPEVLGMSDRVLVMQRRPARRRAFDRAEATPEGVGAAMTAAAAEAEAA